MCCCSGDERSEKKRPVIIHRAILGSVERMIAILCENYGGKWYAAFTSICSRIVKSGISSLCTVSVSLVYGWILYTTLTCRDSSLSVMEIFNPLAATCRIHRITEISGTMPSICIGAWR